MARLRTEITEIVTGLGMLGFADLDRALEVRPRSVTNVEPRHYDRLDAARHDHDRDFATAWRNGVDFAYSADGLRGRPPWSLEWKGSHRPPGYDQIPADLRIDHVYLISCKYGSNVLTNSSPANLFDRLLAARQDTAVEWFADVAPRAYQEFYAACRSYVAAALPDRVTDLDREHRTVLKRTLPRHLTGDVATAYRAFCDAVATASAARWSAALPGRSRQEEMLWRLLRLQPAPYFVLGQDADGAPIRYRVATPWDFRNRYRFRTLDVWPDAARAQPVVRWRATVRDRVSGRDRHVDGHVEVRWSHGRFAQAPEAKVYLDTPHHTVPGYEPLAGLGGDPGGDSNSLPIAWA